MADGSIRIDTTLDTSQFVKEINDMGTKAKTGLQKLDDAITASVATLDSLEKKQQELTQQIEKTKQKIQEQAQAIDAAKAKQAEQVSSLKEWETKLKDTEKALGIQKQALADSAKETETLKIRYETLRDSTSKNTEEVNQAKKAYEDSKLVLNDNREAVKLLEAEYKEVNGEYKNNVKAVKESDTEVKKLSAGYKQNQSALDGLQAELEQTNGAIQNQKEHLATATSGWVKFKTEASDISKSMKQVSENLNSIGKGVTDIGTKMSIGITAPLSLLGKNIISVGMDFEASLSGIKAVTGATVAEMELLKSAALKAGEETKYSASESAKAIEELAKAGLTTAQILDGGLSGALVLAAAGEIEVADAAEIASTVLNAFKKDALSVGDAANILAGAANASATDVGELKFGLSAVSAVAAGMGMNFKDTATALAVFAQNSLRGSDAGTSLKTMLMNLQPSTDKQIAQFQELGLLTEEGTSRFYDMNGSMRPLNEIAGLLNVSMADLTEAERAMALEVMFGSDAIRAGNILFAEGAEGVNNMADAMMKIEAADVAAERMNNLKGRVEELGGKFETLKIKLFDTADGALSAIVEKVTDVVKWMLELDSGTLQTIVTIAGIAAVIGPVLVVMGSLISSIGSIAGAISIFTEAISIMGLTAGMAVTPTVLLSNALSFLTSSAFIVPAAIIAVTVAIAKLTPIGDAAYAVLVGMVAGFVAFKTVSFLPTLIAGITAVLTGVIAAFTGQALATSASTISLVAYGVATKAIAAAQAIATAAIATFNVIVSALSGGIPIVTAAQWLWNAAMAANPVGLIVAGVAALAAGIAYLVIKFNEQSEATKQVVEETNRLVSLQTELIDSYNNAGASYDDNMQKMEAQSQITKELADQVVALTAEYQKSGQGYDDVQLKIEQLNKSVPELSLAIDEETGRLNMSTAALYDKVAAQEAQLELNAQLAEQQRLKEDEIRLELELATVQEARLEVEKMIAESTSRFSGDRKALNEQLDKLTQSEEEYSTALADISTKQEILNPLIADSAKLVRDVAKADLEAETASRISAEAIDEQIKLREEATKVYEEYAKLATNALEKIQIAEQKNKDGTIKTQQQIRDELKETVKVNTQIVDEWTFNLEQLEGKGLDPQFVRDLRDAGPESAALVAALVGASDEEIKELNDVFENGSKTAIKAMQREMGLPETINSGADMIDEVAKGIQDSRDMEIAAAEQVTKAKKAMNKKLGEEKFQTVGDYMVDGVVKGLDDGTSRAAAAGGRLINAVFNSMNKTAETASPSKRAIELAGFIGDGVVVGSESKEGDVANAGSNLAEAYLGALQEEFDGGMQDASVIMLGDWKDVNQGMTEIIKTTGADKLQATINSLDAQIKATEKKNAELAKAEEVAAKERAVKEAKNGAERAKAQDELNKLLAKNNLDSLKEQKADLEAQLQESVEAYNDMSEAITTALKVKYTEQRDIAKESLNNLRDDEKEILDEMLKNRKDSLDEQMSAQEAATKFIIEQHELEYESLLGTLGIDESAEIAGLQARIDGIDAATEAEERALKQQANQQKLADLQLKIQQADTAEELLAAQQKYNEEVSKQQRDALLQQRADEKKSLKDQIQQVKDAYKTQRDEAKETFEKRREWALEDEKIELDRLSRLKTNAEGNYKELLTALEDFHEDETKKIDDQYKALTDKDRLEAEARELMLDSNQQELIDLLNKYVPDWGTAGRSAGQAYADALQGVIPSIESKVQHIMGLINQASQAQSDLNRLAGSVGASTTPSYTPPVQQSQPTQQTYTVKGGDTLGAIALKYGVPLTKLREVNGLSSEDDTRLPIGKVLRIPILHDGGISTKEQLALIDSQEAVIPLAELGKLMRDAVLTTANSLVSGFVNRVSNVTTNNTTNNNSKPELNMYYYGDGSRSDMDKVGRYLAERVNRESRRYGNVIVGSR